MPDQLDPIENNFRHILIAAKRAEQLIAGARPRVTSRHAKPTTLALEELKQGVVPWRPVSPEEYELLLQEELAAKEKEEHAATVLATPRPPIPVVDEPEIEEEEELDEFEEELEGPDFAAGDLAEVEGEAAELPADGSDGAEAPGPDDLVETGE